MQAFDGKAKGAVAATPDDGAKATAAIERFARDPDRKLVPGEGLEPPTNGLQNRCSTAELTRLRRAF